MTRTHVLPTWPRHGNWTERTEVAQEVKKKEKQLAFHFPYTSQVNIIAIGLRIVYQHNLLAGHEWNGNDEGRKDRRKNSSVV